jgi:hypothetical protein
MTFTDIDTDPDQILAMAGPHWVSAEIKERLARLKQLEAMNNLVLMPLVTPKQIVCEQLYLCGPVTSGDHPIEWVVYRGRHRRLWYDDGHNKGMIPADEQDALFSVGVVYYLPATLQHITKGLNHS